MPGLIVPGPVTTDPTLVRQELFSFLSSLLFRSSPGQEFFCSEDDYGERGKISRAGRLGSNPSSAPAAGLGGQVTPSTQDSGPFSDALRVDDLRCIQTR